MGLKRINGKRAGQLPVVLGTALIEPTDVATLSEARGTKPLPLQRLSNRHHVLAEAVASGKSTSECAILAGLTASRVSVLKGDKTFQDLVAWYRTQAARGHDLMRGELIGLSFDSVTEARRRVEEEPDQVSTDELIRLGQLGLDRTGYGPKREESKTLTLNFGDRLNAARKRVIDNAAYEDITPKEAAE